MKKKYQVFLSSTYEDLREERGVVMGALLDMDFIPCGMELFPAADEDQWSLIRKLIDECDYYIIIVGGRYGSIDKNGTSYTQLEYEYAISKGKPTLAFLYDNVDSLPGNKCERSQSGKAKLTAFREVCKSKMCKFWSNPQSLSGMVCASLTKLVQSKPAVGWIRADQLPATSTSAEDFFYTLDERPGSSLPDLVKGATRVSVLARTAVNLLSQYERVLEEIGKAGCSIRILYISPTSEAAKFVYGGDPKIYEDNARKMIGYLNRLKLKMGELLQVKTIDHAPTISLIIVEHREVAANFIVVQLYFLHSRVARDRPLFKVFPTDKWYPAFSDEFKQLWRDATCVTI